MYSKICESRVSHFDKLFFETKKQKTIHMYANSSYLTVHLEECEQFIVRISPC